MQVRFQAATRVQQSQPPAQAARLSLTPSNESSIASTHRLLPSRGSNVSTSFLPSSSPVPMLSRLSISSTTETSCFSSEMVSSRRSSALPQDSQKQGLSPVGEDISLPSTSAASPVVIRITAVDEIVSDNRSQMDADHSDKMMLEIPSKWIIIKMDLSICVMKYFKITHSKKKLYKNSNLLKNKFN